jgi:hypothetical protein
VDYFPAIAFDYRIFIFAMPFFMLAWSAAKLRLRPDASAPWFFLLWFGLGFGLAEFLASAQYLSQAVLAMCALGAWTGLGIYRSKFDSPAGRKSRFPISCIITAVVLSVAVVYAAMDRDSCLYEPGEQGKSSDVAQAALEPQQASQSDSHAERTWAQIMADRRQMGFNFLKGAILVAVCLVGVYQCWNVGRCVLRPKKQADTFTGLPGSG